MVEKAYALARDPGKVVEKIVIDENIHYLHMLLPQGDGLPEHFAQSNVYMTVLRGTLSIRLNDQPAHAYEAAALLRIPSGTKMNVRNESKETLELIVVKAPAPKPETLNAKEETP